MDAWLSSINKYLYFADLQWRSSVETGVQANFQQSNRVSAGLCCVTAWHCILNRIAAGQGRKAITIRSLEELAAELVHESSELAFLQQQAAQRGSWCNRVLLLERQLWQEQKTSTQTARDDMIIAVAANSDSLDHIPEIISAMKAYLADTQNTAAEW